MSALTIQLDQLENAQLVRRLPDEELAYLFKHALTQESAYESLLVKRRRAIHRRAAEAYEKLYAYRLDEFAALLAEHYSKAGDVAKTLEYSVRAGEAAARVFANIEALLHFRRALEAFTRLPNTEELARRHTDVILRYLDLFWGTSLSEEESILLTEAEAFARSLRNQDGSIGDPHRLARVNVMRAGGHLARAEYKEAMRYAQQVLDQSTALDDPLVAAAAAQIGVALVFQGHFSEAEPNCLRAISLTDRTPDRWEWSSAVGTLGISLAMRGQTAAGLTQVERALARAEAIQNGFGITMSRACLLVVYLQLGDVSRMLEESKHAIESAVKSGHPLYASLSLALQAVAESRLAKHGDAQDALNRAFEVKAKLGGQLMMSDWLGAIHMEVLFNSGRAQEALDLADGTVGMAESTGGIFAEGWARRIWAQALATLDPKMWEESEAQFTESVRLHVAGEAHVEAAHTHLVWGRLLRKRGNKAAAEEHLAKADAQFRASELVSERDGTK